MSLGSERRGRGRISSIDELPEWADEARLWAFDQLKRRRKSQLEILDGFNDRLRAASLANDASAEPPMISRSAFNRASVRSAVIGSQMEEVREVARILAPKVEELGDESLTLVLAEMIKTVTFELLSNMGKLKANGDTAQMVKNISHSLKLVVDLQNASADGKKKREAMATKKAAETIDHVAKAAGLSADTVNKIKANILGIERPGAK